MPNRDESQIVRIDLTEAQQAQVKGATEKSIQAIELTVQELEARIAPRISANHNQTMLVDA